VKKSEDEIVRKREANKKIKLPNEKNEGNKLKG
jgi:hypothetical protein